MNKKKDTPAVQSISRATEVLHSIAGGIHSIKEISLHCGLSLATAHRILRSLEETKFVFQDPVGRKYYIGPAFDQIMVDRTITHQFFIFHSSPEVNRIWERFGEFTGLDIHMGLQRVHLLSLGSRFNFGVTRGFTSVLYGADAKILLSQHREEEIDSILQNIDIEPPSDQCSTDREELKQEIMTAKSQGYFISKEFANGIMGISDPIKGYICPAAISLAGPVTRLDSIAKQVVKDMKAGASRIERNLSGKD